MPAASFSRIVFYYTLFSGKLQRKARRASPRRPASGGAIGLPRRPSGAGFDIDNTGAAPYNYKER
jgi:hypothetical protein